MRLHVKASVTRQALTGSDIEKMDLKVEDQNRKNELTIAEAWDKLDSQTRKNLKVELLDLYYED